MSEIHEVPIVEVHTGNFNEIWPGLVLAIRAASFVAIDTELSGLGDRGILFAKSIDDRYKGIGDVAKTRSIIAFGLSCFKLLPSSVDEDVLSTDCAKMEVEDQGTKSNLEESSSLQFVSQTFNIFVLCTENYIVEPLSLKFLIDHGFDFNRQYAQGLPYTRGNDQSIKGEPQKNLRQLFIELIKSQVPIILHNALVDLVFIYESLYASLPASLPTFLTDLSQIFSGGIYDTKYITEFKSRLEASFLEYAFRKSQRDNSIRASKFQSHLTVKFLPQIPSMEEHVVLLPCGLRDQPCVHDVGKNTLCRKFAGHGWCNAGINCPNSHDVDLIIDAEDCRNGSQGKPKKKNKKAKQRAKEEKNIELNGKVNGTLNSNDNSATAGQIAEGGDNSTITSVKSMQTDGSYTTDTDDSSSKATVDCNISANRVGGHRAGFDAFMTGYIFASFVSKYRKSVSGSMNADGVSVHELLSEDEEYANKVYLGGKDFPLQILPSNFSKPSKSHLEKWQRLHLVDQSS